MLHPIWCAPARPGLVTGLRAEARVAARLGEVQVGGGLPAGAAAAAERLVAAGATALVSFGLCGGLDPRLEPGAVVVPRWVGMEHHRHDTDADLSAALGGWSAGTLWSGRDVVAGVADKRALRAEHGADAIDLESGAVAEVAARHGVAFAVLRGVCDPATMALPPAALLALDTEGRIGVWRVAASVLAAPSQVPALIALARAAAAGRAALVRRVGDILGQHRLML